MAATDIVSAKTTLSTLGADSARGGALSQRLEQDSPDGRRIFNLLVAFTFILMAQPQSFFGELGSVIPIAQLVAIPAILMHFAAIFTGRAKHRPSSELTLALGLTIWFLLGTLFSIWPGGSVKILTDEWFKTLIVFYLLTQYLVTLPRIRLLLWSIYLSGLTATGVSVVLARGVSTEYRFLGLTYGIFSGNFLGIAAGATLPFMAATLMRKNSFLKLIVLLTTFVSFVTLTVMTASRGNIIGIVLSLFLVWLTMLKESAKGHLWGVVLALALLVAVALAPSSFWSRVGTLWKSDSQASDENAASAIDSEDQRQGLLQRSVYATLLYPVFGVGLGNFEVWNGSESGNAAFWKGTHNTFTQMSSEAGIPALILFLCLLFGVLRKMRRISKACVGNPELKEIDMLARASIVSIVTFMVGGFFAHLAYAFFVYYLAGIGVGIQRVFDSCQAPDAPAPNGRSNGRALLPYRNGGAAARA